MKILADDDIQKLKLLDKVFSVVSLEDLQQIFTADLVVDKLKGNVPDRGILEDLYFDNSRMSAEIQSSITKANVLESRLILLENKQSLMTTMQSDLQSVVRALNTLMPNQTVMNEFQNLKSRNGIYP